MADPFIGEIRMFGGNYAPRFYAFCEGQLLPIAQNTALFSLVGTMYGGNGSTNFALPDLRGRSPMHAGNGPGLLPKVQGEQNGNATVALTTNQIPSHTHTSQASSTTPGTGTPASSAVLAGPAVGKNVYGASGAPLAAAPAMIGSTGAGQPHQNRQPYLGLSFIIALQGLYPSRS